MSLTVTQATTPSTQPEWLTTLYSAAVTLGLPTTSWRARDPERVFLTLLSFLSQRFDAVASAYGQAGLLDFAATGTMRIEEADGTVTISPISPDPSDASVNPNGDPTFLDALCEQNYLTTRIRETSAGGTLAILNTSASTYGPYAIGAYHVANPTTKATYSNSADVTIIPSATISAVSTIANSGGLIKVTTSVAHSRTTGDVVFITGVGGTTEANGAWVVTVVDADEFTLQGSAYVNAYTSGGTVYRPTTTTVSADVPGSASSSYNGSNVISRNTVTQTVSSLIGVSVANPVLYTGSDTENNVALAARAKLRLQAVTTNGARGAYEFYALSSIDYAPLLIPAQEVSTPITKVRVVEELATGKVSAFIANAAGAPSTEDKNATDAVLQGYAKPWGITLTTIKATEVTVNTVITVYLPAAFATTAVQALFVAAVQAYYRVLPIGGLSDPAGAYTNVLPIQDVKGLIYETAKGAQIQVDNLTATLNGSDANISLPVSISAASVAVQGTLTITLVPT